MDGPETWNLDEIKHLIQGNVRVEVLNLVDEVVLRFHRQNGEVYELVVSLGEGTDYDMDENAVAFPCLDVLVRRPGT